MIKQRFKCYGLLQEGCVRTLLQTYEGVRYRLVGVLIDEKS